MLLDFLARINPCPFKAATFSPTKKDLAVARSFFVGGKAAALKVHGFIRAKKSTNVRMALAAEGWFQAEMADSF